MKIPCFIINRDRLNSLKGMIDYLNKIEELQVIIIDNASTYQPLLDYYDTNPCIVHLLTSNYGNCSPLFNTPECIEGHIKPNFLYEYNCTNGFILSDSDLDLSQIPTDFLNLFREGLAKYSWATKIGFQLRIDDLPDTELAKEAIGWEQGNHSEQSYLDDRRFMKAPIDTTFAFYRWLPENPNLAHDFDKSIRTAMPYSARHLTWYNLQDGSNVGEDEKYYYEHLNKGFNH
mgnify:FL=1